MQKGGEINMHEQKQLWDQQEGEPTAAYVRFLAFRNLGPGRTVKLAAETLAQQVFMAAPHSDPSKNGNGKKPKKNETQQASVALRTCYDNSALWNWTDRAEAWDIWRLLESCDQGQTALVDCMKRLACAALEFTTAKGYSKQPPAAAVRRCPTLPFARISAA